MIRVQGFKKVSWVHPKSVEQMAKHHVQEQEFGNYYKAACSSENHSVAVVKS